VRDQFLNAAARRRINSLAILLCLTTALPDQLAAQLPAPWLAGSTSATHYSKFLPFSQVDPNPTGLGGTLNANILNFAPATCSFRRWEPMAALVPLATSRKTP
jgi:hypothetical protein